MGPIKKMNDRSIKKMGKTRSGTDNIQQRLKKMSTLIKREQNTKKSEAFLEQEDLVGSGSYKDKLLKKDSALVTMKSESNTEIDIKESHINHKMTDLSVDSLSFSNNLIPKKNQGKSHTIYEKGSTDINYNKKAMQNRSDMNVILDQNPIY